MQKKIVHIVQEASAKVHQVKQQNGDAWDQCFVMNPIDTLYTCMRQVGKTGAGAHMMPGFAKTEGTREMFEQAGRGACEMIKQVGSGVKTSVTQMCSKYVDALQLFAKEAGCTKKYVFAAQKTQDISRCLLVKYDLKLAQGGGLRTYKKVSAHGLTKIVETFFLRNSNTRSGARARVRTTFRELPMQLKDLRILWYAQYINQCHSLNRVLYILWNPTHQT